MKAWMVLMLSAVASLAAETKEQAAMRLAIERNAKAAMESKEWRVVGGVTNTIAEFYKFEGEVLETQPTGVRIRGRYCENYDHLYLFKETTFFVANYPRAVVDGTQIAGRAKPAGIHRYTTVLGGSVAIQKLDYGREVAAPEPNRAEIAMAVARAEQASLDRAKAKKELDERTVKYQLEQAEKGLPSFQYEVGKRYLRGDGVDKDEAKARTWFEKAAAQGESLAVKALAELK